MDLTKTLAFRLAVLAPVVLLLTVIAQAETASNTVPPTRLGITTMDVSISQVQPAACSWMALEYMLIADAPGTFSGTHGNDLLIGVPGVRTINGEQGSDCIVGNAGARTIDGGPGTDVCIGPASATFRRCEIEVRR